MIPSVSLVSVRFLPSTCVWAVHLPRNTDFLGFISGMAVFQSLILWGRVSLLCGWCCLVPEDSCMTVQPFGVHGKSKCRAGASVSCPQLPSLFLYWWVAQFSGSPRVLCLQKSFITSTECTPSRGITSEANLVILRLHAPVTPPCFPIQTLLSSWGMTLLMLQTSRTLDHVLHH